MNVKRTGLIVAVVGVLVLALALPAVAGGRPLSATLTGAAEVPPVDSNGSGTMELTLNQGQGKICFDLEVADVAPLLAAHIHVGEAGANGGVVVNFDIGVNGLEGCVDVDKALVKDIRQNPGGYYINVHNADYPAGALRGQLEK